MSEKVSRIYFEVKKLNGLGSILRCYQCVGSGFRVVSVVILSSDAGTLVPGTRTSVPLVCPMTLTQRKPNFISWKTSSFAILVVKIID